MLEPLLSVENLSVNFRVGMAEIEALKQASFEIYPGETLALVGESGSGKSAMALSILKLLPYPKAHHPSGRILFEGQDLLQASPTTLQAVRGGKIGMIFQEPMMSLNPLHTIKRQLTEMLVLHQRLDDKECTRRVLELLDLSGFTEGKERLNAYPHQLSGGQRQRVLISMALACSPSLLIADEPTTALDVTLQVEILTRLKAIQEERKMAMLLITHNLSLVEKMADRILVMCQGEIVEEGLKKSILLSPQHAYTKRLLTSEPKGTALPLKESATTLLEGKDVTVSFEKKSRRWFFFKPQAPILAVNHLSFTLRTGETLGVVGESGSGKTTLALAILRLTESEGTLLFQGKNMGQIKRKEFQKLRKSLQIVFQDPFGSLNPRLSIHQIISEGLDVHHLVRGSEKREERVCQVLKDVGLDPLDRHRYPHEFSGGQRQRIAISRALVLNPSLIILDEPTSSLDLSIQAEVLALLKKLQEKHGFSYLFISHDLKVVRQMSHRIIVMQKGKVIEHGPTETVFTAPNHRYTKTLIAASLAFEMGDLGKGET